jgi:hypothetical protein
VSPTFMMFHQRSTEDLIRLCSGYTRHSQRDLEPIVSSDSKNLRPLLKTEIQDIDHQLRESDMHLNGLTEELYEDLQKFQVPDDGQ